MEATKQKQFSVVLKLDEFDALNGELMSIDNDLQRENYINQFFLNRFGEGKGKLEIVQKKSKVKLMWLQPRGDSQADAYHSEAITHARNKQYNDAINNWVKAISLNPTDPEYYFNLGIAFFESKNFKESIENLRQAISLCPIYYKAHLILGTVYLKVRQFENAEKHLKESIIFYPNHSLAYLNLGAVYSILKRYDEGVAMFLKTLKLTPNEVRAHFGLAKIYSFQGHIEKANRYYRNVIEIDANRQLTNHAKRAMISVPLTNPSDGHSANANSSVNAERYYQEGYAAFLYTDYEKSIQMYTQYLRSKSNDDFVWFSLGECYLRTGQVLKSIEAFQKSIAINPNKALYYKELAISFDYLNKENEVLDALRKAQKLGKSDSISCTLMGKILVKQHDFVEAIDFLEKAIKLNANNLLAKLHLAVAYAENNDRDLAINSLQEIVRSPINSPIKMQAETLLEKL